MTPIAPLALLLALPLLAAAAAFAVEADAVTMAVRMRYIF